MEESMRKRLEAISARYEEIENELSSPDISDDIQKLTKLSREKSNLEEASQAFSKYLKLESDSNDALEMENSGDDELIAFTRTAPPLGEGCPRG